MDLGCPNTVLGVQIRVLGGFDQNLMEYKGLMANSQNTCFGGQNRVWGVQIESKRLKYRKIGQKTSFWEVPQNIEV